MGVGGLGVWEGEMVVRSEKWGGGDVVNEWRGVKLVKGGVVEVVFNVDDERDWGRRGNFCECFWGLDSLVSS